MNAREQLLALPPDRELAPGARNAVERCLLAETEHGLFAEAAQ